jgi:hypothetical protein
MTRRERKKQAVREALRCRRRGHRVTYVAAIDREQGVITVDCGLLKRTYR